MNENRQVVIWRSELLSISETFIANQTSSLRRWHPTLAGLQRVANGLDVEPGLLANSLDDPRLIAVIGKSDLVHAHFGPDAAQIAPVARKAQRPLMATFHGYDATVRHLWWAPSKRRELRFLFESAHTLIGVSEHIATRLRRLGAPKHKVVVHHIGIPISREYALNPHRSGVLFVGRLVPKKGCADMLRAVASLPSGQRDVPVTVIGEGPLRGRLERLADNLRLNTVFLGVQPPSEVRHHMRRASVLCAPSKRALNGDEEGLPITLLEAQLHGLPIVATRSSGIPEAVIHERTGLLAAEGDWRQLGRFLAEILGDSTLCESLAAGGRRNIEDRFDLRKQSLLLEVLYDEAVGRA